MLYLTTRSKYDPYTAARTLEEDQAPDGGFYLPYLMPSFNNDEIQGLKGKSFGQCVADILNLFFSTHLTAWDVEFCVGRHPLKVIAAGHRVLVAEIWRNLDGSYDMMERRLAAKVIGCLESEVKVTSWLRIAIRIAVLFGIFSELMRDQGMNEKQCVDVAVPAGDFSLPMALWYGRSMGLPIGTIICSCGENSFVWDFLHVGECPGRNTGGELERLVCATLGYAEAERFASGEDFALLPELAGKLRAGMFSAVISRDRMASVISNVYRTNSYILEPDTAFGYSGLMDYRAKTGENRTSLLLADVNPVDRADTVAAALDLSVDELKKLFETA